MFSHLSRDLAWPLLAQENLTGSQPQVNYHGCRLAARQQTLNLVKKSIWNNWKSNFSWRIIAAYFGLLLSSLVRSAFLKEKEIKKYSHIHNRPIVEFSRWLLEYFNTYRTLQNLCLRVLTSHGVSLCFRVFEWMRKCKAARSESQKLKDIDLAGSPSANMPLHLTLESKSFFLFLLFMAEKVSCNNTFLKTMDWAVSELS